jgi:hypothetical protein
MLAIWQRHRYAWAMTIGIASLLFALASFIITFAAARALAKWLKQRGEARRDAAEALDQSRQVRRAKERRGSL